MQIDMPDETVKAEVRRMLQLYGAGADDVWRNAQRVTMEIMREEPMADWLWDVAFTDDEWMHALLERADAPLQVVQGQMLRAFDRWTEGNFEDEKTCGALVLFIEHCGLGGIKKRVLELAAGGTEKHVEEQAWRLVLAGSADLDSDDLLHLRGHKRMVFLLNTHDDPRLIDPVISWMIAQENGEFLLRGEAIVRPMMWLARQAPSSEQFARLADGLGANLGKSAKFINFFVSYLLDNGHDDPTFLERAMHFGCWEWRKLSGTGEESFIRLVGRLGAKSQAMLLANASGEYRALAVRAIGRGRSDEGSMGTSSRLPSP